MRPTKQSSADLEPEDSHEAAKNTMHVVTRQLLQRPCPVCDFREAERLHHQRFAAPRELHVPQSYDVVACRRCGLVYADQSTAQRDLDRDYEAHSKYAANVAHQMNALTSIGIATDAPWDARRLEEVAEYLASRIAPSTRILDAGCSSGTFLRLLVARGFKNAIGLDPSHAAVASAMRVNGVHAYAGSFTSPPDDLGTFDVVVLSHTLEHLADVRGAIESLRRLLRPEGIAYIEVPDAARYDRYLVAPFHDYNTEHINHFSLPVLCELMRREGFDKLDGREKVVHCSAKDEYPAIFGLWRKQAFIATTTATYERDESLVRAARRYIEASHIRMRRIDDDLRTALAENNDIIVWGAGQLAMKLLGDTVLADKRVAAIVDSSPQRHGMHLGATEIVGPEIIRDLPPFPIVITSIHSDEEIAQTVSNQMRLPNSVIRLYREDRASISST